MFLPLPNYQHASFFPLALWFCYYLPVFVSAPMYDAFAKTYRMAKQKFRPTRLGVFSGVKAYI
jgi:hypothetical protein